MNQRDTQFAGFANLLIQEIDEQVGAVTEWGVEHDIDDERKIAQELAFRWRTLIARRAYDLVKHAALETHLLASMNEIHDIVHRVPDMPELPEE